MRRPAAAGAALCILTVVAATVVVVVGPGGAAAPPALGCAGTSARLTVEGSGTATATPDLLTVDVTVSVTGPSAAAALSTDDTDTAAVTAVFRAGGVAAPDLETTDLSVGPDYQYAAGIEPMTGYRADDTVVAKLRDLAGAGPVIDAVSVAGGDAAQIGSLSFSLADPRPLAERARADAVGQAVADARAMARAAGERLGPVCSITDQSTLSSGPVYHGGLVPAAPGAAVPLSPGTQEADAQVKLVYGLG